jgi:tRNA modification GTPase
VSYDPLDTIAAIATAPGGAARGMVRLSGPATEKGVRTLFRSNLPFPSSPAAIPGVVEISLCGAPHSLPCQLFLWPTHRSYTREPVAEFHTLGSPPLLQALLDALCQAGARLAEPGEFTLRAFLAGRLDLTQAEAVLGVIDAHGADEFQIAIGQLAGNLAAPLHQLRDELLALLAALEAGLDFVEEDIEFISADELTARLETIATQLAAFAAQMSSRLTVLHSRQVVLVGPPNAGKSSLFNALARRFGVATQVINSALVSPIRGTTRDYLTTVVEFNGSRCDLVDTAGIELHTDTLSPISAAARSHAAEQGRRSLVRIRCVDASSSTALLDAAHTESVAESELVALTKIDLAAPRPATAPTAIATSSVTGEGLDALGAAIAKRLAATVVDTRQTCIAATADRCRDSIRLADAAVSRASDLAAHGSGDELIAAEIHVALTELGKIVGAVYTDDLLDHIFKTFCIGK